MPRKKNTHTNIGPLSGNSGGIPNFVPPRVQLDPPTRVTNSGSRSTYSQTAEWSSAKRPGSMDAFLLLSHGVRC